MDKIFKPDERRWISPLVNLTETAKFLQEVASNPIGFPDGKGLMEYKPPWSAASGSTTTTEANDVHTMQEQDVQKLINILFRPTTAEAVSAAEEEDFKTAFENMAKLRQEFDSTNIDYDMDDSHVSDSDLSDYSDSSDEDAKEEGENTTNGNEASECNDEVYTEEGILLKDMLKTMKEEESAAVGEDVNNPLIQLLNERDRKHDVEFGTFNNYNDEKARERAKKNMRREEAWFMATGLSKEKYWDLAKRTSSIMAYDCHEVMVDDNVTDKVEMPLLAGPVPHKSVRKLTTLALYTSLSDEPGNFQWKSTHVMEQLTVNQQREKQLMREHQRNVERMEPNATFPPGEFIVTVSFYQPSELSTYDLKSASEPKPGLEIEVLGSHTLAQLKNKFFCQRNMACTKDCNEFKRWTTISDALVRYGDHLAMDVCRGDVMYIHDTCYTDGDEKAKEHFDKVRAWICDVAGQEISEYKEGSMDTRIADLNIRFGYPYMYLHQGDCEHIMVFTSMRLPRPVEFTTFPRHEIVGKFTTKFCRIDKEFLARWIVCGSDRFPEDPILLCNSCVEEYCFTKGSKGKRGKKIGNFKLYPFLQITAFI